MRKTIVLTALALACAVRPGAAAPLALPGDTPIYFQFNNLENVSLANDLTVPGYAPAVGTQGNWGVFNVSSIQIGGTICGIPGCPPGSHQDIAGGGTFFADDGPGGTQGMVTGIFYGIQIIGGSGGKQATGGFLDLYWHDAGADTTLGSTLAQEANCLNGVSCGPNAGTVGAFTSGTFLGRLAFASGVNPANGGVFIQSDQDPTNVTGQGHADSYANVVNGAKVGGNLGAWQDVLDGNWFDTAFGTRDVRFSNTFFVLPGNQFNLKSNDPGRVFTSPVPEPASLTLLGLGLLGAAARRRKKA